MGRAGRYSNQTSRTAIVRLHATVAREGVFEG